jgi:PEP-CTERM motif
MLTNKITKTFASGVTALASSLLVVSSVSAQSFTDGNFAGFICSTTTIGNQGCSVTYDSVILDDKIFQNFVFTNLNIGLDQVVIDFDGQDWSFEYDPVEDLSDGTYSIGYDVDITDPNQFFDLIQLDTVTSVFPSVTVTKTITDSNDNDFIGDLESLNGSSESIDISLFNTQHISVLDEIVVLTTGGGSAELEFLSNDFTQDTHDVPEPGTILGLLTVGGLGLVSRFKKQK